MDKSPNLDQVKSYFDQRIKQHGASPRGSDWNSETSQNARFEQLVKVAEGKETFSILDYGCGYGALADYLEDNGYKAEYYGFDILESAVETARIAHTGKSNRLFISDKSQLPVCDYAVASGIFNYCGSASFDMWTNHVTSVFSELNALSRKGFACNFLTKYSDAEKMRDDLYYADPLYLFDYCKRNFSKNVALLHDYFLYDFTLVIRKDT